MQSLGLLFAYFTPETTLPMATAISAILGFVLLFVRAPVKLVGQSARRVAKWARSRIAPGDR